MNIGVAAGKFKDAAGNQNLDTYSAGADSAGLDSPPATATGNTGADGEGDNAAPTP